MLLTLHALVLAAIPVVAAFVSVRYGSRPTVWRVVAAVVLAAVFSVVCLSLGLHRCNRGGGTSQAAIAALSLAVVLASVGSRRLRLALAGCIVIAGVVLTVHAAKVAHGPGTIGRANVLPGDDFTRALLGRPPLRIRPAWHSAWTGIYLTN